MGLTQIAGRIAFFTIFSGYQPPPPQLQHNPSHWSGHCGSGCRRRAADCALVEGELRLEQIVVLGRQPLHAESVGITRLLVSLEHQDQIPIRECCAWSYPQIGSLCEEAQQVHL